MYIEVQGDGIYINDDFEQISYVINANGVWRDRSQQSSA